MWVFFSFLLPVALEEETCMDFFSSSQLLNQEEGPDWKGHTKEIKCHLR